nr:MAG TPA: hypothetical protein [Crassvirales sp.]
MIIKKVMVIKKTIIKMIIKLLQRIIKKEKRV